jgi:hypothetical protein
MHSKLYIDTKRNRALVNNDTRFELDHGRDVRQALAALEKQRALCRHKYEALLEHMKDTNKVSAQFDAIVEKIRRCDIDISKLYQEYANINSATFADANTTKQAIKEHKDAIHALYKRQDPHHIMNKDVKKIVAHTKTINELRNHLKTLETVFFVPGRKVDSDEEEAPPKAKKGRKSKDSDEDEAPPKPPKKGRKVDIDEVKKRVKPKLTALFKFKNAKECLSRAKTVFMSRDDIIKTIESHDDLKNKMPTDFKKLTKEALCEKIESLFATPSPV